MATAPPTREPKLPRAQAPLVGGSGAPTGEWFDFFRLLFARVESGGTGGPATTDELPEGVENLYFTDERAQDALAADLDAIAAAAGQPRSATWSASVPIVAAQARYIDMYFPEPRTITGVTVLTQGGPGSCVIDIFKAAYAGFPPASSICAAALPTIATATKYQDNTLTGWTVAVAAGDCLRFRLVSSSNFTDIVITLGLSL